MNEPESFNLLSFAIVAGVLAAISPACGNAPALPSPLATGSGAAGSLGNPSSGGSSAQPDVTGGTSAAISTSCLVGTEQCDCYGNGTCNAGLVCASNLCVNLDGLLSGSGGATVSTGGASGVSSAGSTASGGSKPSRTTSSGGMGGSASGGVATGGARVSSGGTIATGGRAATGGQAATGGSSFWTTVVYSPSGAPSPADGHHNPSQNCAQCHVSGSTSGAPVWMFGGTVYQANATTPAPNVQVGINDGTGLYTTYTAANGNFWFAGSATINWAKAQVRIRNANGESTMVGATPSASCNLCHNSTTYPRITAP
jgi:hypothetical protein